MTAARVLPFSAEAIESVGGRVVDGSTIELDAHNATDIYVDPVTREVKDTATVLSTVTEENRFQLSARVRPQLLATFDAGALFLRTDATHWAKLCLEKPVAGGPTAVSVVTRGTSDDANGWELTEPDARMRLSRDGEAFAFHVSTDGERWDLLRVFTIPAPGPVEIGLIAQSPMGDGCTVSFSELAFKPGVFSDPRSGR